MNDTTSLIPFYHPLGLLPHRITELEYRQKKLHSSKTEARSSDSLVCSCVLSVCSGDCLNQFRSITRQYAYFFKLFQVGLVTGWVH